MKDSSLKRFSYKSQKNRMSVGVSMIDDVHFLGNFPMFTATDIASGKDHMPFNTEQRQILADNINHSLCGKFRKRNPKHLSLCWPRLVLNEYIVKQRTLKI